jgi:FKBP-type peptidyl-prolyl cis-trans isomerase
MKYNKWFVLSVAAIVFLMTGCSQLDYKKTKTGLLYKIISTKDSKGPVAKNGDVLKFNFIQKTDDTVLRSSYGKLPGYQPISGGNVLPYDPSEIFSMLRKGDSAVTVLLIDSLISKGILQSQALPPSMKRGGRILVTFKVLDLFTSDSVARKDLNAEMVKDQPRRQKEMKQQLALQEKQMNEQRQQDEDEYRKSGEIDRELKSMKDYLVSKKITADQTGKGTFVVIKQQGTGPALNDGDTVTVKYTGKRLVTDSVFQSSTYTFPLGKGRVIEGWDEGLKLFKTGGNGTLYIPGFLAYGKNGNRPFKPFDPLIFDIEVLSSKPAVPDNE